MAQELQNSNTRPESYSLKEAAKQMGISYGTLWLFLKEHPDMQMKHTFMAGEGKSTGKSKMLRITKEGMLVVMNTKNISSSIESASIVHAKQQLAEAAVQMHALSSDPLTAALQIMLATRQEMQDIKQQLANLPQQTSPLLLEAAKKVDTFLSPTTNESLTHSQRKYIAERINAFVIRRFGEGADGQYFSMTRRTMNDFVGKRSIDDYTMEDYTIAIKWLKREYAKLEMEW